VTRAHGSKDSSEFSSLSAEGRLRRAATAWRGILFRDRRKRCEPQDRKQHATRLRGHGGVSRQGGAKPRRRYAGWELAFPSRRRRASSNASRAPRKRGVRTLPGVGLRDRYDGGAIFGQPHERKPGFAAGSQGPERVGIVGAKVRRVARISTKVLVSGPVEGPRGPERGNALQGRGGQQ